jgi:hypothetical protein
VADARRAYPERGIEAALATFALSEALGGGGVSGISEET